MTQKNRKLIIVQYDDYEILKSVEIVQEGIEYSFAMMPHWNLFRLERVANNRLYEDTIQNRDMLQDEVNRRRRSIFDFEVGDLVYVNCKEQGIGHVIKVTPKTIIVDIEEVANPIRFKKTKAILIAKAPE